MSVQTSSVEPRTAATKSAIWSPREGAFVSTDCCGPGAGPPVDIPLSRMMLGSTPRNIAMSAITTIPMPPPATPRPTDMPRRSSMLELRS